MRNPSGSQNPSPSLSIVERIRLRLLPGNPACVEIERLVSLAADNQATPIDLTRIDEHIAGCQACRELQTTIRACSVELRERPSAVMPSGLSDRLIAAIEQEEKREGLRSGDRQGRALGLRRAAWSVGAVMAAGCIAGLMVMLHSGSPSREVIPVATGVPAQNTTVASNLVPALGAGSARSNPSRTGHHAVLVAVKPSSPTNDGFAINPARPHIHAELIRTWENTGTAVAVLPKSGESSAARSTVKSNTSIHSGDQLASLPKYQDEDHVPSSPVSPPPATTPVTPSAPTQVASVSPPAEAPTTVTASYNSTVRVGLMDALRLARQSQGEAASATVSVAAMTPRPDYSSSISMVSSSFR